MSVQLFFSVTITETAEIFQVFGYESLSNLAYFRSLLKIHLTLFNLFIICTKYFENCNTFPFAFKIILFKIMYDFVQWKLRILHNVRPKDNFKIYMKIIQYKRFYPLENFRCILMMCFKNPAIFIPTLN